MIKFRTPLNILTGRIRYGLARLRKKLIEVSRLSEGHWRWAALAVLISMGIVMAGMGLSMTGEMPLWIFLLALVFFLGIPLLAGLGARLGLRILNLLPPTVSWILFGSVFFVFFFFGSTVNAKLVLALFLVLSGSFLGAGLYNVIGGRWRALTTPRQVLTVLFLLMGAFLFIFGWFYLLYPGKAPEELKAWAMESKHKPVPLEVRDPSLPGTFGIDSLTYGWGKEKPRPEFGPMADIRTEAVDGSSFLDGWDKFSGKMRSRYWKMGPDSLALNGKVWYPMGEGPFPLVLMVHGNHADRDFSDPGYDYLGRHFASHGIIAVTVDENFLNGAWHDSFGELQTENDCRGWLLLKHLELWREWNRSESSAFCDKVDMDRIVLIGHSRGGEAVSIAAAFNILPFYPDNAEEVFDFDFGIRGIAAIAPVDGQYWPAGTATPLKDVNYFTIHGSMDGDMRSYDGLRQMRRVQFTDSAYHFASGLYVHGANHGQFNRSWGIYDNGYPNSLFFNRHAIIPAEQQEKVALVYLTAFLKECFQTENTYLPLFRDYRRGKHWLPDLVLLNQFHESTATILCDYEEDLDLSSGTRSTDTIWSEELALWKEGRIPKRWGDLRNNGVFLGWNNDKDSVPGFYEVVPDSALIKDLQGYGLLTFLAADAQMDPGERSDTAEVAESGETEANVHPEENPRQPGELEAEEEEGLANSPEEEGEVPVDFCIVLTDGSGREFKVRLGDHLMLQPPIKPQVFKSGLFSDDAESEVVLQYVAIPLEAFQPSPEEPLAEQEEQLLEQEEHLPGQEEHISVEQIRSIRFVFDAEKKGSVIIDQLGFARE
jgi:dienelactone hydrolase